MVAMAEADGMAESDRVAAIHELANAERKLRGSTVENVRVRVDSSMNARIGFDTGERNESFRSSITASLVQELATADGWEIGSIHDPLEREEELLTGSLIDVRRDRGGR